MNIAPRDTTQTLEIKKKLEQYKVEDPFWDHDVYCIPVNWIQIKVSRKKGEKGYSLILGSKKGRLIFFGFCMLHGRVFTVNLSGHILVPFGVRDLYIEKGDCEEGHRCLNVTCPFNQTTKESFLFAHGLNPKKKKLDDATWAVWVSFSSMTWEQAEQGAEIVLLGEKE